MNGRLFLARSWAEGCVRPGFPYKVYRASTGALAIVDREFGTSLLCSAFATVEWQGIFESILQERAVLIHVWFCSLSFEVILGMVLDGAGWRFKPKTPSLSLGMHQSGQVWMRGGRLERSASRASG